MKTPTHYNDVCEKALEVKEKCGLTDVQTLLYNHICRGDFKLRNEDGQNFHDKNNNGFGWGGDRNWVKKQLKPLIKDGLVKFESLHDCRDGKYTSWYFYSPEYDINDLVDAGCFVNTELLVKIKHYLNLEDGFDKKNKTYGDIEFIHNEKGYTFKYKGQENVYLWDDNGKIVEENIFIFDSNGEDINDVNKVGLKNNFVFHYETFQELLEDIWSVLRHDGYEEISKIPNYTNYRTVSI